MNTLMLGSIWQSLLAFLFCAVGVLMIGIILLQKNRGAGLSGAFGGVGGHSAFGTKTGDFLTWVTVAFTATLILLAVVANFAFQPTPSSELMGISAPPAPTSPMPIAPPVDAPATPVDAAPPPQGAGASLPPPTGAVPPADTPPTPPTDTPPPSADGAASPPPTEPPQGGPDNP